MADNTQSNSANSTSPVVFRSPSAFGRGQTKDHSIDYDDTEGSRSYIECTAWQQQRGG